MIKFAICVCLFATHAGASSTTPTEEPQVDSTSYMFAIFKDQVPVCAGTVVENAKVLYIATAAHCVYNVQNSRLLVSQGNAVFDGKKVNPVFRVIIHPYYSPSAFDYDIALLKVKLPEKNYNSRNSSGITALTLTKVQPGLEESLTVINWNFKAKNMSLTLGSAKLESKKSCQTKLGNRVRLSSKMLCANIQSVVVPDGGPLIFSNGLLGVASYNSNNETLPIVFTNIANSEIYSFIEEYV